jgi:hypothetical protein
MISIKLRLMAAITGEFDLDYVRATCTAATLPVVPLVAQSELNMVFVNY